MVSNLIYFVDLLVVSVGSHLHQFCVISAALGLAPHPVGIVAGALMDQRLKRKDPARVFS